MEERAREGAQLEAQLEAQRPSAYKGLECQRPLAGWGRPWHSGLPPFALMGSESKKTGHASLLMSLSFLICTWGEALGLPAWP